MGMFLLGMLAGFVLTLTLLIFAALRTMREWLPD